MMVRLEIITSVLTVKNLKKNSGEWFLVYFIFYLCLLLSRAKLKLNNRWGNGIKGKQKRTQNSEVKHWQGPRQTLGKVLTPELLVLTEVELRKACCSGETMPFPSNHETRNPGLKTLICFKNSLKQWLKCKGNIMKRELKGRDFNHSSGLLSNTNYQYFSFLASQIPP